jgi:hypothetical protein
VRQLVAAVVGLVFLLVGLLGFIPGVTTDYALLAAGHHTGAQLFGVFEISLLQNIVYLAFGFGGLLFPRTERGAQVYLVVGGILYLGLWLYGLLIDFDSPANFLPVNAADNWLHLGLGVAMVILGFVPLPVHDIGAGDSAGVDTEESRGSPA